MVLERLVAHQGSTSMTLHPTEMTAQKKSDSMADPSGDDATDVKTRIEQSAIRLFGDKGFAATSVREIVEAAGVTKPSLYYYFKDKNHLYERLIMDVLASFHDELAACLQQPGTIRERLERIALTHFEHVKQSPLIVRFMFRALFGYGARDPQVDFVKIADRNSELIHQILEEAAGKGEIPSGAASETSIIHFMGMVHIYMMRNAIGMEDNLSPDLAKQVVQLYLEGLRHSY